MIVDDEQPCIDELEYLFTMHNDVIIGGTYTNPVKALEAVPALKPDVVFLDISMPFLSGIELAGDLININHNIQVVFVTAHFRLLEDIKKDRPFLWMLKPVSEARLNTVMESLRGRLH